MKPKSSVVKATKRDDIPPAAISWPASINSGIAISNHESSPKNIRCATIEIGKKADLNVIDMDALHIRAPEMVYDLPGDGRRLIQKVDGYRYTIKSGEVIYKDGEPTGALPGNLVRGPQVAPEA